MLKAIGGAAFRAARRIWVIVLFAKGKSGAIIALAAALGLGAWIASVRPEFMGWLKSDWTHSVFAGSIVLSLAAFTALWQIEFKLAGAESVQLLSPIRTAEFRSEVTINQGNPYSVTKHNVLFVGLEAAIHNGTPHPVHILRPSIELLEKHGFGYRKVTAEVWAPTFLWRCPNAVGLSDGFKLPDHQKTDCHLGMYLISPVGAAAFLEKALKLKVVINVVGRPEPIISEGPLPIAIAAATPTAPPPADPPSTTASV
jgi:hypothetical protein